MSKKGKQKSDDDGGIDKGKAAMAIVISGLILFIALPYLPNIPWLDPPTYEGLSLIGNVEFANHSAVSGTTYTSAFVDSEIRSTKYSGIITGGTFSTNQGPEDGGTFDWYINIAGAHIFVETVEIPESGAWDNDNYYVGTAILWPAVSLTGSNWNVLMTRGSVANSFTGGGSAASTNFTATAGSSANFDFKVESIQNYAQLFRQYTDPYDSDDDGNDIPVAPCLWIEIGTETNVYQENTFKNWQAGGSTMYLIPLSALTATGSQDISAHWAINLVFSSAASLTMKAWIVDGSHPDYLLTAKNRVANPFSGETVTAIQLLDTYVVIS